ncbi:MAG TPA: rRNA methyltransferase, partial [Candidatus Omnitrophica bacterium]|nr:rRNA methyltransferase [Candidatus Omnitrophota bacterium]
METLITCKEGYEKILANEAALYHGKLQTKGRGWIIEQWDGDLPQDLCFAYHILKNPLEVSAVSVNDLSEKLLDLFTSHVKEKRIVEPWPLLFFSCDNELLIHRAKTVEKNWLDKLQKKMSRVAKLSQKGFSDSSKWAEGFFVHLIDFTQALVSFEALGARQQRMQMDPQAPSRSYLKIEEAFHIFGCEPGKNDTVIDLGAAPGGWSHSALKRGASVIAIDNGPL